MMERLAKLIEERQRSLQAAAATACIGAGAAGVAGAYWALIVVGLLLLGDALVSGGAGRAPRSARP